MKRPTFLAALFCAAVMPLSVPAIPMASQPWVTNRMEEAKAALRQEIAAATNAIPAPGNYAAVSNAAINSRGKADLVIYEPVYTYSDWTWTPANDDLTQPWYFEWSAGEGVWQVGSNEAMAYVDISPSVTDPDATNITGEVSFGIGDSSGTYTWTRTRTQTGIRPSTNRLASMDELAAATNNIPRPDMSGYATIESLTNGSTTVMYANIANIAESANQADNATSADSALSARSADTASIAYSLMGATAQYSADDIADEFAAIPQTTTNIVRSLSLGGIWDAALEVWWTPRMSNGRLTYEATTNVNLNAEN